MLAAGHLDGLEAEDPDAVNSQVDETGNDGTGDDNGEEIAAQSENPVSEIAMDKNAKGTMTLPNGKEIENHGLAVKEAAKQLGGNVVGGTPRAGYVPEPPVPAGPPEVPAGPPEVPAGPPESYGPPMEIPPVESQSGGDYRGGAGGR
ncbi:MAG: hypothetical protein IBX61_02665 [Thermoleophilia bacterium]|nr:hypothetical protein [Thermoleophilia bacterium]